MAAPGSLMAFRVGGDQSRAFDVMNRLQLIAISNNLGDAKSLITHPTTTTHQRLSRGERLDLGITDDLVRLSIGLEAAEDLMQDLDQALVV
jgi:O-succinylhomoserine sulfhydrylase